MPALVFASIPRKTVFAVALICALTVIARQPAQAQTFTVLHTFTGGADGANPLDGLSMDRTGNLYGTASTGGDTQGSCLAHSNGCGVVFEIKPRGSGWVLSPLYTFTGSPDGRYPVGRVVLGPDDALYGTTQFGGVPGHFGYGCGTVYRVSPAATSPRSAISSWTETMLYAPDCQIGDPGYNPLDVGGLVFDASGNIYGTMYFGGPSLQGTVFELIRSGNQWTPSTIYNFTGLTDGSAPAAGVTLHQSGNVFGTTNLNGCNDCQSAGTVYELTPSQSGWTEITLHAFIYQQRTDPQEPNGGVIFDSAGNLYGSTLAGGIGYGGTVFQLAPSSGGWNFSLIYSFQEELPEIGPVATLLLDSAGNLYGTTYGEGQFGYGNVFKLSPSAGGWSYTSLYDFQGGSDGAFPQSTLIIDSEGNLYGTASEGGSRNCESGCGTVWEITP